MNAIQTTEGTAYFPDQIKDTVADVAALAAEGFAALADVPLRKATSFDYEGKRFTAYHGRSDEALLNLVR